MSDSTLINVRSVNAFTFCPRLFWLEEVEGVFEHNAHTLKGAHVHKRVDKPGGAIAAPNPTDEGDDGPRSEPPPWHARSLWLSCDVLGVSGKLDLVEEEGGCATPVDTKKGRPPKGGGLWPADAVQLTLQALLLRRHGYTVDAVTAWYHETRQRVSAPLTEEMIEAAMEKVAHARALVDGGTPPPPLVDSPKCGGCSLAPVCLPDELSHLSTEPAERDGPIRQLLPPRDDALPLYIQTNGTKVGVRGGSLKLTPRKGSDAQEVQVGIETLSQLNLMGGCQISTQALKACLQRDIPVGFFSHRGWYYGRAEGTSNRQVHIRVAQFAAHGTEAALAIARVLIADKLANQRTLLRRNADGSPELTQALRGLKALITKAQDAPSPQTLLGFEGDGARRYWPHYSALLTQAGDAFEMQGRNRRPPRDRTNALLSFGYAFLVKDATLACTGAGFDPYLGIYHTAHHGRPSLALDLMEPFRPLIVDSVVLQMVRRSEVQADDFIITGQAVALKPRARKALIQAYERRMDELITHPVFGYRVSYRRTLMVHARLMARVLTGELPKMPSFRTR